MHELVVISLQILPCSGTYDFWLRRKTTSDATDIWSETLWRTMENGCFVDSEHVGSRQKKVVKRLKRHVGCWSCSSGLLLPVGQLYSIETNHENVETAACSLTVLRGRAVCLVLYFPQGGRNIASSLESARMVDAAHWTESSGRDQYFWALWSVGMVVTRPWTLSKQRGLAKAGSQGARLIRLHRVLWLCKRTPDHAMSIASDRPAGSVRVVSGKAWLANSWQSEELRSQPTESGPDSCLAHSSAH